MSFRDLSDLPPAADVEGEPPTDNPILAPLLAQAWAERDGGDHNRPLTAEDHRLVVSQAGQCARRMGYDVRHRDARRLAGPDVPRFALDDDGFNHGPTDAYLALMADADELLGPTNPPDLAAHWTFGMGNYVHDTLQAGVIASMPTAQAEVDFDLRPELDCHGRGDLLISADDGYLIACEIKGINGWGFKSQIGGRGGAEGPRIGAKIQGALMARKFQADELVIVSASFENNNQLRAAWKNDTWRKFLAEWRYEPDTYMPWAEREIKRMTRVLELVDAKTLPPRRIVQEGVPAKAEVVDVVTGRWELYEDDGLIIDSGQTWQCGYCPQRDRCAADLAAGDQWQPVTIGGVEL